MNIRPDDGFTVHCPQSLNSGTLKSAEIHILKEIQRSEFSEEVKCLIKEKL